MSKNKASMDDLNSLHQLVAMQLKQNLDDPRVLSQAIKFLKDNDITADIVESESLMSLTDSIKKIASQERGSEFSVEDMINISLNAH